MENETQPVQAENTNQPSEEKVNTEEQVVTTEQPQEAEQPREEKQPEEPRKPRKRFMMPVDKATAEKKKAIEKAQKETEERYETRIRELEDSYKSKLEAQSTSHPAQDRIAEWSEKYNGDPEAAKELLNIMSSTVPQQDMSKYDELIKQQEFETQKQQVSKEFDTNVVDLIKAEFPSATPEQIAQAKQQVSDLAFSEEYASYPVSHIFQVNKSNMDFSHGYSAETGSVTPNEMVDFESINPQEILKYPRDVRLKYFDWQDKKTNRWNDA